MNSKEKLKNKLVKILGLKNVVLSSSCRNALYTLLESLNLKSTDEIIVQSFICSSLPNAIKKAGASPIITKVNPYTLNLELKEVEKNIGKNTKAVIFVHTYGNPTGIEEISALCKEKKIILIEDIAHALGASSDGRLAGTFGDYAIYSFTKQMINFGGGALITNKNVQKVVDLKYRLHKKGPFLDYPKRFFASLYETRAFFLSKILIDLVRKKADLKFTNSIANNFLCSNLEAYFALKQLKDLPANIRKRRENFNFIKNRVQTQKIEKGVLSAHNYLAFFLDNKKQRDDILPKNCLYLPPWPSAEVSDKLIFVPNRPSFSRKKLLKLIKPIVSKNSLNTL